MYPMTRAEWDRLVAVGLVRPVARVIGVMMVVEFE